MALWTVHLEGGPRRVNHAAVTIGKLIFSFGGYCTGEDFTVARPMDIHVLNTGSILWAKYVNEKLSAENTDYTSKSFKYIPSLRNI